MVGVAVAAKMTAAEKTVVQVDSVEAGVADSVVAAASAAQVEAWGWATVKAADEAAWVAGAAKVADWVAWEGSVVATV